MTLTLEALAADDGDCLLLHHGTADEPRLVLVDGGRAKAMATTIEPRLGALRRTLARATGVDELAIGLAVLSHIDADHIDGMLKLTDRMVDRQQAREPQPWWIGELWANTFDEVVDNAETHRLLQPGAALAPRGVAASIKQARGLRDNLEQLQIPRNLSLDGELVARADDDVVRVPWGDLALTVLAPTRTELQALERAWDRWLEDQREPDAEVVNAASIVLLAEQGEHSVLLTGDARTEDIVRGLTAAGRLSDRHPTTWVDVLKLPHHGAEHNCQPELFERVLARHYVISAQYDDKNGNPDLRSLERLWSARGADHESWTVHVTFRPDTAPPFEAWRRRHPEARVVYRAADAPGVEVALR